MKDALRCVEKGAASGLFARQDSIPKGESGMGLGGVRTVENGCYSHLYHTVDADGNPVPNPDGSEVENGPIVHHVPNSAADC